MSLILIIICLFGWLVGLWYFHQYFSEIVAVSFIGGGNGVPEKTTDGSEVTDKPFHLMLYQEHLTMNGVRTHKCRGERY